MAKPLAIRPTLADRIVNYFDPVSGARRYQARATQALADSYVGGSRSKRSLVGWFTGGGSADADLLPSLATMRERSRDMHRNNPIARGAINTVVTNVVGTGLVPQPKIDFDALGLTRAEAAIWQKRAKSEFSLWADSKESDASCTQTFYEMQSLAFRSVLCNGDHFVLTPSFDRHRTAYRLRLQMVEADRCSNPQGQRDTSQFAGGVELDKYGAPIRYHFRRGHPGALDSWKKGEWDKVDAFGSSTGRRNVLHLFERLRADQTRGEPYLAPVIDALRQLGEYTEAELKAAVISGLFTVFIETEDGESPIDTDSVGDYSLGSGAIITGMPGDKVQTINPGRPNVAFDPFVQAILRQVGVALELPFEVLIKHFTASYSAARAALLDAWRFYKVRRWWLAGALCQPVYELWMDEAVSSGRLSAPGYFSDQVIRRAYQRAQWVGDAPGSLDPYKEAVAAEKNLVLHRTTLEKETMTYDGSDWEDNVSQAAEERRLMVELGLPLAVPSSPTPEDDSEELTKPARK